MLKTKIIAPENLKKDILWQEQKNKITTTVTMIIIFLLSFIQTPFILYIINN